MERIENVSLYDLPSFGQKTVQLSMSKRGLPCAFERGGAMTSTGEVQLVADSQGNPKPAMLVRTHGELACDDHVLFKINVGDIIVHMDRHCDDVRFWLGQFVSMNKAGQAIIRRIPYSDDFKRLLDAASEKVRHYHCRCGYYYIDTHRQQVD